MKKQSNKKCEEKKKKEKKEPCLLYIFIEFGRG